jgi:SAM-dependent methyltransferase
MQNSMKAAPSEKSGADTYSSAIASAHRYMEWMLEPFLPYLHGDIVEIGIGHGSYCEALAPLGTYYGLDIDERSVEEAQVRYPNAKLCCADILEPKFLNGLLPCGADAIVSINVLEHVKDDAKAISNLVAAVKPGGWLMISVPAMMALYNDLDRLAGHHRRYHLQDFSRLLSEQPVRLEKLCYFNPIGGLGWWVNKFRRHESLNSTAVNNQILLFEKYILPISRLIDPVTRGFFGQSAICVVQRL